MLLLGASGNHLRSDSVPCALGSMDDAAATVGSQPLRPALQSPELQLRSRPLLTDSLPPPRFRARTFRRAAGLRPQHRITLGLLAMSGAAFLLTILAPRETKPIESVQQAPTVKHTPRGTEGPDAIARDKVFAFSGTDGSVTAETQPIQPRLDLLVADLQQCALRASDFSPVDGWLALQLSVGPAGLESTGVLGTDLVPAPAVDCLRWSLAREPWPPTEPAVRVEVPFLVVQPATGTSVSRVRESGSP